MKRKNYTIINWCTPIFEIVNEWVFDSASLSLEQVVGIIDFYDSLDKRSWQFPLEVEISPDFNFKDNKLDEISKDYLEGKFNKIAKSVKKRAIENVRKGLMIAINNLLSTKYLARDMYTYSGMLLVSEVKQENQNKLEPKIIPKKEENLKKKRKKIRRLRRHHYMDDPSAPMVEEIEEYSSEEEDVEIEKEEKREIKGKKFIKRDEEKEKILKRRKTFKRIKNKEKDIQAIQKSQDVEKVEQADNDTSDTSSEIEELVQEIEDADERVFYGGNFKQELELNRKEIRKIEEKIEEIDKEIKESDMEENMKVNKENIPTDVVVIDKEVNKDNTSTDAVLIDKEDELDSNESGCSCFGKAKAGVKSAMVVIGSGNTMMTAANQFLDGNKAVRTFLSEIYSCKNGSFYSTKQIIGTNYPELAWWWIAALIIAIVFVIIIDSYWPILISIYNKIEELAENFKSFIRIYFGNPKQEIEEIESTISSVKVIPSRNDQIAEILEISEKKENKHICLIIWVIVCVLSSFVAALFIAVCGLTIIQINRRFEEEWCTKLVPKEMNFPGDDIYTGGISNEEKSEINWLVKNENSGKLLILEEKENKQYYK